MTCNESDVHFEIAREKEVKLQKQVSSNNDTQRWSIRFERDRVLGNCKSAVLPLTRPPMPATQPIRSSKYPPLPSVPSNPLTPRPNPLSKYPPSLSVPTTPSTQWDQDSAWYDKSYILKVWHCSTD